MTPTTLVYELADLICEHSEYCQNEYQPYKLAHMPMAQALDFQNEMTQSLSHFAMWLDTVKKKQLKE